jgi:hypothetical protein
MNSAPVQVFNDARKIFRPHDQTEVIEIAVSLGFIGAACGGILAWKQINDSRVIDPDGWKPGFPNTKLIDALAAHAQHFHVKLERPVYVAHIKNDVVQRSYANRHPGLLASDVKPNFSHLEKKR